MSGADLQREIEKYETAGQFGKRHNVAPGYVPVLVASGRIKDFIALDRTSGKPLYLIRKDAVVEPARRLYNKKHQNGLTEWAQRHGILRGTAYAWYKRGLLKHHIEQGQIIVDQNELPPAEFRGRGRRPNSKAA